jgi:hypothetical protein
MGLGEFGGNGSVNWVVDVGNARAGSVKSNINGKGHRQEGTDETEGGQAFHVTVEIPNTVTAAQNLANELENMAKTVRQGVANSGMRVGFNLPIEPNNEDQIQIRWNSKP